MIVRVGVAIAALIWIHGLDRSAQDAAEVADAIRDGAPRAALSLCAENAGLCQEAAGRVITATVSQAMEAPTAAPAAQMPARPQATDAFPLPPRRPMP